MMIKGLEKHNNVDINAPSDVNVVRYELLSWEQNTQLAKLLRVRNDQERN